MSDVTRAFSLLWYPSNRALFGTDPLYLEEQGVLKFLLWSSVSLVISISISTSFLCSLIEISLKVMSYFF